MLIMSAMPSLTSRCFLVVSIASLSLGAAQAAVTLEALYHMGEEGSVNTSSPPYLADSVNGHHLEHYTADPTIQFDDVAAPGSVAYVTKTNGGWYHNVNGANRFNRATDWATQIWIRPGASGGTLAFQTDSQDGVTTGEAIWFRYNGLLAFGSGNEAATSDAHVNITDIQYELGVWYRIGIVNYGGRMHYYVDGEEARPDPGMGEGGFHDRSSTLGALQVGMAGGYNQHPGAYDELSVWFFDSGEDSLASVKHALDTIPEPGSALLGALGMLLFARRRRA